MNFVAVKLSHNYADEFQVEALWLTTRKEFISFLEELEKRDISEFDEVYFGANEFFFFDDFEHMLYWLGKYGVSKCALNLMKMNAKADNPFILNSYAKQEAANAVA